MCDSIFDIRVCVFSFPFHVISLNLLGISKSKTKELREGTDAAKSCEEISLSAEESVETVGFRDHEENLSNKSSQKVQKGRRLFYLFPVHLTSCRLGS